MMAEAVNLAIYGMGTVFVFLTVLVFLTSLMSKLVALTTSAAEAPEASHSAEGESTSPALLAAVTAAVKQYRERH